MNESEEVFPISDCFDCVSYSFLRFSLRFFGGLRPVGPTREFPEVEDCVRAFSGETASFMNRFLFVPPASSRLPEITRPESHSNFTQRRAICSPLRRVVAAPLLRLRACGNPEFLTLFLLLPPGCFQFGQGLRHPLFFDG